MDENKISTDNVEREKTSKSNALGELFDWLEIFVISIATVFIIFTFVMRIAIVNGPSMKETLHGKDALVVSNLFYKPEQGDVIVFQSPYAFEEPLVKRVIATEGQTVKINFSTWEVEVDGKVLDEPYVRRVTGNMLGWSYGDSYTVPEGHVFVMGDNRNESMDSRDSRIGPVDTRMIIGQVKFRFFPLNVFGTIK